MNLKLKENSSTVLLKVYDDDNDFVRCNYAIVKITKEFLETITKLRKGRDAMGCHEVSDFNYSCVFLNQDELDEGEQVSEEMLEELEDFTKNNKGSWQIEPVDMKSLPKLRTDGDQVHVSDFGIKFSSCGKHSGVNFDTEKISWEEIDKMIVEL